MGSSEKPALVLANLESPTIEAGPVQQIDPLNGMGGSERDPDLNIGSLSDYPTRKSVFDRVDPLSESYNGFCVAGPDGELKVLPPSLPDEESFFLRNGEPAPLEMQYMMELVSAQSFPSSNEAWDRKDPKEKFEILQNAVRNAFAAIRLPAPSLTSAEQPDAGQYFRGQWRITVSDGVIGKRRDSPLPSQSRPLATRFEALRVLVHQSLYALQDFWLLSWFAGHTDTALPEVVGMAKDKVYNAEALSQEPMASVSKLAEKYPTRVNPQIKALVDGWPADIGSRNAYRIRPNDKNYDRLFGQGMGGQAEKAAFSAIRCRQILDRAVGDKSK